MYQIVIEHYTNNDTVTLVLSYKCKNNDTKTRTKVKLLQRLLEVLCYISNTLHKNEVFH